MNVVDSSGWLEYFAGSRRARHFEKAILATDELLVPAICVFEVFKIVSRERSEADALFAISAMQEGILVEIDTRLAIEGARLSLEHRLPMADSLILAVTRQFDATLWTQDADFKGLEDVEFFSVRQ
ncbi:MAG: type II toxin-antitoxin system VapC family toxin [Pseudomonadales bacterium]|jgi:predicted nucleic acid-binding protein|nr:type II toxin-antitoxin system VapC family toxin [Pseudomonadales bacterium]MDP7357424.1 type II toxin-antitoxin system VapC family toxin [Pseudomonadales bacterium]MDP7595504.1 type II toxin-antitoxin system VapC family toxin [Pseudomonadales bacterium]HJN52456.1 type II toxin-antitoxin system VapC family toxin [Pseudomonadales bacterium]|tara:strand:+ start:536 stop:913 length:378 start_codon:yes stop_codon:yes gene_type:complete